MARISAVKHIDAAPEKVWDVATDLAHMGRWVSIHQEFPDAPPRELTAGDRFRQTLRVAGVTFHVEWTATEIDEPRQLLWHGTGPGGSDAKTKYLLEPEDGGTRFTFENEFSLPAGLVGRGAAKLVAGQAGKQAGKSLDSLKKLIEG